MGSERQRKLSVFEAHSPSIPSSAASGDELRYRRRKSLQARRNSRDRDCFVPEEVEEWVLPEYRSLFHHLFLKDEDDSSSGVGGSSSSSSPSSAYQRRRKISPSGSTGSSTASEEDGPFCNWVKKLKKVFHISENNDEQAEQSQEEVDAMRHAWLDEIPIDICDRLRHIHIYV